jgi:hypothetical protein
MLTKYIFSYVSVRSAPLPLKVIAAFLRLGKKYEIAQLRLEATSRLSYEFPSMLDKWDDVHSAYVMIEYHPGLGYDIVKLARELGLCAILPAVLFAVSESLDLDSAYEPIDRGDGTSATLSVEDQIILTRGWWRLIQDQARLTFGWLDTTRALDDGCISQCIPSRKILLSEIFPVEFPQKLAFNALDNWDPVWERNLCYRCIVAAKKWHEEGRDEIWHLILVSQRGRNC